MLLISELLVDEADGGEDSSMCLVKIVIKSSNVGALVVQQETVLMKYPYVPCKSQQHELVVNSCLWKRVDRGLGREV